MQKRTREIAALVLLGLLVVVAALAMGYYILIGHNWNQAASSIDERLGTMDDYTVIIYQGTLEPVESRQVADNDGAPTKSVSASEKAKADAQRVTEASRLYGSKGAAVFLIDLDEPRWYKDPIVLQQGDKKVGVFSIGARAFTVQAMTAIRQLERQGADYIVAISLDERLCKQTIRGLDLVICPGNDSMPKDGVYQGSVFCLGDEPSNEMRAVIVSPSGVHSSKIVE